MQRTRCILGFGVEGCAFRRPCIHIYKRVVSCRGELGLYRVFDRWARKKLNLFIALVDDEIGEYWFDCKRGFFTTALRGNAWGVRAGLLPPQSARFAAQIGGLQ